MLIDFKDEDFHSKVKNEEVSILQFSASWCQPCKILKPIMEKETGLSLSPVYSYNRVYVGGSELKKHIDRPACEISISMSLRKEGKIWPIYIDNTDYKKEQKRLWGV